MHASKVVETNRSDLTSLMHHTSHRLVLFRELTGEVATSILEQLCGGLECINGTCSGEHVA